MKKLLAILLCVVLFAGVTPAAAFAEVNLAQAYGALNTLDNAYAQLAVAVAYKNGYDGFMAISGAFRGNGKGEAANLARLSAKYGFGKYSAMFEIMDVMQTGSGISYEDLFSRSGYYVYVNYELVGEGVVADAEYEENRMKNEISEAAEKLQAQVLADALAAADLMIPEV